ncbi:hypothetical protein MED121_15509 [Marinomonas sp. MED121]|uniref:DUF1439 domain-containing protein n=1 Tax=Marinomonas sp. MED121 TaxID=314277 RepID=UPI00006911EE|nr:DUF1439 domain-containing protein [Marinomonas sp. MED121]EAQ67347.1 hypothetical protein MED121_15509 [Marinomonas sp. MED121]
MKLIITLIIVLSTNLANAFSYTHSFTEAELQQQIEKVMPIVKQKYFLTMTLSNPQIDLIEGANEIGLKSNINVDAPGGMGGAGQAHIVGQLEYNQAEGAFYFKNARLVDLTLDGVSPELLPEIKKAAQSGLTRSLSKRPVYVLKDSDVKQKIAKSTLQSIMVKNQELEITFGIL